MKKDQGKDTLVSGKSKPAKKVGKKEQVKMREIVKGLKLPKPQPARSVP